MGVTSTNPCLKPNDYSVRSVTLKIFLIGAAHHLRSSDDIL